MSKISRIRIMNLNYNHNTIRVDDETFDLDGESTLISLRNGGGKSVLVQMIVSLFVDDAHRRFDDRPFKSYFTTNKPTFLMTEWKLDNNVGYFLVGMMVRKNQGEDSDKEDLEMYTFTGSYRAGCAYDLDNLSLTHKEDNRKMLKSFSECRRLFEELKKEQTGDFNYYDMSSSYARKKYYKLLAQYQINHKEWENIIWKVNQKESGLSELFQKEKDERSLVEKWFLQPVEDKLGQNKIDEFRKLTFQFLELYQGNQSKLQKKAVIEQYFEDTKQLKEDINSYIQLYEDREEVSNELLLYVQQLGVCIDRMTEVLKKKEEELDTAEADIRQILYEQISYEIYQYEDEKREVLENRLEAEAAIMRLDRMKKDLFRQITVCDCSKIYSEIEELQKEKAESEEQMSVLLRQSEDSRREIEGIGHSLYCHYHSEAQQNVLLQEQHAESLSDAQKSCADAESQKDSNNKKIQEQINRIGNLESSVRSYDKTEKNYNERYHSDISRNILGFYEEGLLTVTKKEQDAQLQNEKASLTKNAKKKLELESAYKKLEEEAVQNAENLTNINHQITRLGEELQDIRKQKEKRLMIMKYADVTEEYIEQKDTILAAIDGRIREIETDKIDLAKKQSESEKRYHQLKEGKIVELPDNIRDYFIQNGMDIIYGMEWLSKNGRSQKDNSCLVKKNPFLPYAIIMERKDFERFQKTEEELYTAFPIPIILREELEIEIENVDGAVTTFGNMHFFILFNHHLLDKEELERMLEEIQEKLQSFRNEIEKKEEELITYRSYRSIIENQTYRAEYLNSVQTSFYEAEELKQQLWDRKLSIHHEKDDNRQEQCETQNAIEQCHANIIKFEDRSEMFRELCLSYQQYETDMASLSRIRKEKEELEKEQGTLDIEIKELYNRIEELRDLGRQYQDMIEKLRSKASAYEMYQDAEQMETNVPVERLEARFLALTKDATDNMEELQKRLDKGNKRLLSKERELEKKRQKTEEVIAEEEYEKLIFSEAVYDGLEKQHRQAERDWNTAVEQNNKLERRMERLDAELDYGKKKLLDKTGFEEPVARESIVHTNFEERKNVRTYDAKVLKDAIDNLKEKKSRLNTLISEMSEYEGISPDILEEEKEKLRLRIPDIEQMSDKSLRTYQGEQKRKLRQISETLRKKQDGMDRLIRTISSKEEYAEDYFKKTFDNLLLQTGQPYLLCQQYEMNRTSYENQLTKLKIDLENIENEQKNLEELFLEYVSDVNSNLAMIDKNSTIRVRDKNLKMLKIQVPDWETQKGHYRIRLHDYFENVIRLGLAAIEKNENLQEQLGHVITTKKLYDDIIGIGQIKIRLYKIEAERELPITWREVSSNSGGEGFLSAFVVLTCLLSYMRKDENALFASGIEGKVLIMDNPFAQTQNEHLLKPLMEMARKTNTQLICLSAIGGGPIYNRFDNIYVLKLVDSNIRRGMMRMESRHIKGGAIEKLVWSQFKLE